MRVIGYGIVGIALALGAIADPTLLGPAFSQGAVEVTVLNLKLACDREQCRSPVLEVHERTGAGESSVEYVFAPPPDITLDEAHATGVEVDGEGAEHYVRALAVRGGSSARGWRRPRSPAPTASPRATAGSQSRDKRNYASYLRDFSYIRIRMKNCYL